MAKIGINLATGSVQDEEVIVGIDLGTTNSLVALVHPDDKKPIALKKIDGSSLIPSVVHFNEHDQPIVGNEALLKMITQPQRTIYSAKRLMGKSYNDLSNHADKLGYKIIDDGTDALVKVQVGNHFYSPIELSAYILKELKAHAEHILKQTVTKAVITVPAYFNDTQRQATRDAGKLAGIDVLRIINEPTAAALAYGLGADHNKEQTIAVYDLGGGTFDVSILQIQDGIFEVLSTHGDTFLGGDDMDRAIQEHWSQQISQQNKDIQNYTASQELRLLAEQAKKYLSNAEVFEADYNGVKLSLTKEKFEELITPLINRTIDSCAKALQDASLSAAALDAIVMVGGSTRVPFVKRRIQEYFGKPLHDSLNPDEVVAQGAAVQADILAGKNTDFLLLDVTPLSLGIETMGGLMDVLIPRNSKIPTSASRQYTTQKDGQSAMRITVYQGERDLVQDNRKLAELNLSNIPGMPAGLPKVEITFLLDADGILKVTAKELRSGVAQTLEVVPQYGLTDEQVEKMLMDSLSNAQQDIAARALAEATAEATQMTEVTEKFLVKHVALLTENEIIETKKLLKNLQAAINSADKNAIQTATENLNDYSRPYSERVMDEALKKAMEGKRII